MIEKNGIKIQDLIIAEDDDFIFINKTANLLSIPDRFNKDLPNLYNILKEKYGEIYIVHRLDKETSGIICFAKNAEAHRDLNIKFDKGEVKKTYIALVKGKLRKEKGTITYPLAPSKFKKGFITVDKKYGKKAITNYVLLEKFRDFSLVEIHPETGRTHQIRVHFAEIGNPIIMDTKYNLDCKPIFLSQIKNNYKVKKDEIEKPLIERLTLHSKSLEFYHFRKNEMIKIEANMHKDFEITLKYLRKYGK